MTDTPFITALFSDDLRREIGNKESYIGVYGTHMYVPNFPFEVQKIVIRMAIYIPINLECKSVLMGSVHNKKGLAFASIPLPDLAGERSINSSEYRGMRKFSFLFNASLRVENESEVSTFGIVNEENFIGPSLRLLKSTESLKNI